MLPYTAIEIRPTNGGALLSNLSDDTAASFNYSVKLNWRRCLERELRREGHDHMQPNMDVAIGNQPFPYGAATNIAPGGNWSGSADKVAVKKGWSYLYVAGAHEDHAINGEDGDAIGATLVQAATDQIWVYPKAEDIGEARTYQLLQFAPITLIHEARRPNGQRALIVGTPTTLYRFYALDNGAYFDSDYFAASGANTPYFASDTGEWIVIANGFDPAAGRWEAVCINGTSIFNNGRDLPYSYRVEELTAKPVYELRESGIAAVGTICEFFGILIAEDISEIHSEKLIELFDPVGVRRSGAMLGEVAAGNLGRTAQDFFSAADVGRIIVFDGGISAAITAFNSAREVQLGHDTFKLYGGWIPAQIVTPQRFMLRTPATQVGSLFSGAISGTQASGSKNVAASAAIFSAPMVGKKLRYINGWSSVIATYTNSTHVILTDNAPETFTSLPFFIVSAPDQASADYVVTAAAPLFTAGMVGRNVSWEDGTVRKIIGFIDSTHVHVDSDMAIVSDIVGIDNPATYAAYTEKQFINRIAYQRIWSTIGGPDKFAPTYRGSMNLNDYTLRLDQPAKSIVIGDLLTVAGAGVSGGNLTGTVIYVAANRVIALDVRASTAVHSGLVEKAEVGRQIVGYDDLQDDSSGIIKSLELQGVLVTYKDTAIALTRYTGNVDAPFQVALRRIDSSRALFYRNTLVLANESHVFAGRSSFYRFSLIDQRPREAAEFEGCKNLFFDKATLENSKWIFAANNILTKEVFFASFPYTGTDRVLCMDYLQGTVSSSDITVSAAASVKRPAAGIVVGEIEDWFLMGTPKGVVLLYGLVYLQSKIFAGEKQIYFRRDANPYSATKVAYTSRLRGGLSAFGNANIEKDIRCWVPILSSKSPKTPITFTLYGSRNPVETPDLLMTATVDAEENLVPMFFRNIYFSDQLEISGIDDAAELVARVLEISGVRIGSFTRREL